jgi:shikimate dehydrogenase
MPHYERWHTPLAELPARIESLRAPHMYGANVTLPHKIAILPMLDEIDAVAEAIGAANTIIRLPDGACVAPTPCTSVSAGDHAGVWFEPEAGLETVILGASGAARAAGICLGACRRHGLPSSIVRSSAPKSSSPMY